MMNREILFRGKRIDTGKWIYGYAERKVVCVGSVWVIHCPPENPDDIYRVFEVIPETVGRYTGETDKTGKKIFEDDIVKLQSNHTSYYIAEWHKYQWIFRYINRKTEYYQFDTIDDNFGVKNGISKNVEIIGNIHDNPDLLEWRHEVI